MRNNEIASDGERLGAVDRMIADLPLPPAAQSELAPKGRRSRADLRMRADADVPSTDNSEIAPKRKPKRGLGANADADTDVPVPPAATEIASGRKPAGKRVRASRGLNASPAVPSPAPNSDGAGLAVMPSVLMPQSDTQAAVELLATIPSAPPASLSSSARADDAVNADAKVPATEAQEAILSTGPEVAVPPAPIHPDTIAALVSLQRRRRFCIVSQSRCDRSCEAFIATQIGGARSDDEKERKAVWKQASALRKQVEAGGEGLVDAGDQTYRALSACTPIIVQSAAARAGWDALRNQVEKDMRRLAQTLPAYQWVKGVAGLSDLGLAVIVGETGDLSAYATKERVWKRLGLAVIEGFRQRRMADADQAAVHGYNPKRRAEIWAICSDSMSRQQWRGAKDDAPAHANGPYGAVYARRKANTDGREWTPARRDADARRIMTKAVVEDLWRVWNGKVPLHGAPD